jgi:hypothetical protein
MRSVLPVVGFILLIPNARNIAMQKELASQMLFAFDQSAVTMTITEPAALKLEDMFRQADLVALVKTVSGDNENYDVAVYKARVLKGLKGAFEEQTIYYGPYVGEELGSEYIVFLRKTAKPIAPKPNAKGGYGTVEYSQIFNEGYSAMASSYECVFDGSKTSDQCGDAVRIGTNYIVLPKSIPTFPSAEENTPFGCRWVRKQVFIDALQGLAVEQTNHKSPGIPGGF